MFRKLRRSEKGQAMVEFALVLPILLLILCGILDFGWLYFNQLTLNNAAREGARYAAIHYSSGGDWQADALAVMRSSAGSVEAPTVTVVKNSEPDVTATAVADVPVLTGFSAAILGNTKTLTASCTMKIEF